MIYDKMKNRNDLSFGDDHDICSTYVKSAELISTFQSQTAQQLLYFSTTLSIDFNPVITGTLYQGLVMSETVLPSLLTQEEKLACWHA